MVFVKFGFKVMFIFNVRMSGGMERKIFVICIKVMLRVFFM